MTPFPSLSSLSSLPSLPSLSSFPSLPDLAARVLSPESPPLCYPSDRLPRPPGSTPQSPSRPQHRRLSTARTARNATPSRAPARSPCVASPDLGPTRMADSPVYQLLPSAASMMDVTDLCGDWAPMLHSPALGLEEPTRGRRRSVVSLAAGTPSPTRPSNRRSQSALPPTRISLTDLSLRLASSTYASPIKRTPRRLPSMSSLHGSPVSLIATSQAIPEELDILALHLHDTTLTDRPDPFCAAPTPPRRPVDSVPSPRSVGPKEVKGAMLPPPVPTSPRSPRTARPGLRSRPASIIEMPLSRRASLNAQASRRSTVSLGMGVSIGTVERAEAEVEVSDVQVLASWSFPPSPPKEAGSGAPSPGLPRLSASSDLTRRLRTLSELPSPSPPLSSGEITPKPLLGRYQSALPLTHDRARRPSHRHTSSSPAIPVLPPQSVFGSPVSQAQRSVRHPAVPLILPPRSAQRRSSRLRMQVPPGAVPLGLAVADDDPPFAGGLLIPRPGHERKLSSGAVSICTLSSSAGSMTSDSTVSSVTGPRSESEAAYPDAEGDGEGKATIWARMSGAWRRRQTSDAGLMKPEALGSPDGEILCVSPEGSDGEEEYINFEDI